MRQIKDIYDIKRDTAYKLVICDNDNNINDHLSGEVIVFNHTAIHKKPNFGNKPPYKLTISQLCIDHNPQFINYDVFELPKEEFPEYYL